MVESFAYVEVFIRLHLASGDVGLRGVDTKDFGRILFVADGDIAIFDQFRHDLAGLFAPFP